MPKQPITQWISVGLVTLAACPAMAWGPATQRTVVSAAGHVFSRNTSIPLNNLIEYVHQGASISGEEEDALFPKFGVDPVRTIQRDMYLLQGVRSDRVDPYYAYRLGALGKKVTQFAAPLRNSNASLRDRYYRDVEGIIEGVRLLAGQSTMVEPQLYFGRLSGLASQNDTAIMMDYRSGLGIEGAGGKNLAKDASRAVDAVSDVWFTIFRSRVEAIDLSKSDIRRYMLSAIDFYLKIDNIAEVDAVYRQAKAKNVLTSEMNHTIGDLYYDNGFFEQALAVYDELLAERPNLREVKNRISRYHVSVGDQAMDNENLEDAFAAYQLAVQADVLHDDAQRRLILTSRAIQQREDRLSKSHDFIDSAQRSGLDAQNAELRRDYAQSIQHLRSAEKDYGQVTEEFPDLSKQANIGLRGVRIRLNAMKKALVNNARVLSGSGFTYDAKQLAADVADTGNDAMTSTLKADYKSALSELAQEANRP